MKIHGKEIDFKHTRLEDAKRFEKAISNMADANEKYKKTGHSMSEYIRWQIGVYRKFFVDATKIDVLKGCKDVQEPRQRIMISLERFRPSRRWQ